MLPDMLRLDRIRCACLIFIAALLELFLGTFFKEFVYMIRNNPWYKELLYCLSPAENDQGKHFGLLATLHLKGLVFLICIFFT
jgi:hypothetical protein